MTITHTPLAKRKSPTKIEAQLILLFKRVPYGVEVVWVDNGEEVFKCLKPISKVKGQWLWGGESMGTTSPTFQLGTFRMWSSGHGECMLATKQPDIERLREWVTNNVSE